MRLVLIWGVRYVFSLFSCKIELGQELMIWCSLVRRRRDCRRRVCRRGGLRRLLVGVIQRTTIYKLDLTA